jgi:beta-lactamase regulating signal transducer with metallopeptidase domain
MNNLFAQLPSNAVSPEALINAAIAAKAAELAANQVFYMSVAVLFILLVIGAILMFILYRAKDLERNTDGMRIQLVEATRKLALLEGNIVGRAELAAETKNEES